MKMFYRLLIFIAIISLTGCQGNREKVATPGDGQELVIEGQLENGEDQLVTLDLIGTTAFVPLDSVRCDAQGKFSFNVKTEGLNFYSLKHTEHGYITLIGRPGSHIKITGNAGALYPYQVRGSEDSDKVRELALRHKQVLDRLSKISADAQAMAGTPGYAEKKQVLNERFDSITNAFHRFSKEFIHQNTPSPALLIALYNQFGPGLPVFHPLTDLEIYQYVDSVLYLHYPENEAVRSLHSQLATALQQMRTEEGPVQLKPGDKAPDFVMETAEGEKFALTDLRGNYVLVQFWASWSKPSADENRFLREAVNKYADRNFRIVSISIDDNREDWLAAIGEGSSAWYHISDLLRWSSPVVDLYRVERIPANFLVDPAGTIIEKDIFGEEIIEEVHKYTEN